VKSITIPKQSISMNCQLFNKQQIDKMYSNIEFEKNDLGFSWIHKEARISPFNKSELITQLATWCSVQATGKYSFHACENNRRTFATDDGQIWYVVVVQQYDPNGDMIEMPICPVSGMLFGFWVSGMVSAFKEEFWADQFFKSVNNIDCFIEKSETEDYKNIITTYLNYMERLERARRAEEERLERERRAEEERLRNIQEQKNKEEHDRLETIRLEEEKVKADEAQRKLLVELEAEENKKSSPKKKKEKKVKEAKVQVNPHKKEIRVSEGIWKPNPAWKKWEQENKRSASPP